MTTTPAEHDPFFQLLTEALRAGPGSAQWGEAVAKLRDGGVEGADEYRLILRAREDIELGRDFRKVQAGPEFTRKVLDSIEREGTRGSGVPTATIVAIVSGLVILAVIVTVIVIMSRGGGTKDPQQAAIQRLESVSMPVSVASAAFDGPLPDAVAGFKVEKPEAAATPPATQSTKLALMAGLIATQPLDAGLAGTVEVEMVLPPAGTGQPWAQVFLTDTAVISPFATPFAGPAYEVIWAYRDGRAVVYAKGEQVGESENVGAPGDAVKVNLRFDAEMVIVETGGRRLYAGPHGLRPQNARAVGVRFLRAANDSAEPARVKSISVAQAAPPAGGGR